MTILKEHRVTIIRDTLLEFPELWMEVYVEGDEVEQKRFAEMFIRGRCTRANSPETADLVVFTGGDDVNPIYYDEEKHPATRFDNKRDEADMKLYELCYKEGIPMFGVCRGAQFLHVMNGGKLFQHVDNHNGDHPIFDIKSKRVIDPVSSVHHQVCIRNALNGMEVIADTYKNGTRWENANKFQTGQMADVEAFFYRETCCFGVQGHPEYKGYYKFLQWTLRQIEELICNNPDTELRGRCRRIKQSLLDERQARVTEKLKELN